MKGREDWNGEYVVVQYDTQFEQKAAAGEFFTPFREPDGSECCFRLKAGGP